MPYSSVLLPTKFKASLPKHNIGLLVNVRHFTSLKQAMNFTLWTLKHLQQLITLPTIPALCKSFCSAGINGNFNKG